MNYAKRTALNLIFKSLKEEPAKWSFGAYEAVNGKMKVSMKNRYYATYAEYGSIEIGGLSWFGAIVPWGWWRRRLVNAVENAQLNFEISNKE